MVDSISTDKLIALSALTDKLIEKLPNESIKKIKKLSIIWVNHLNGDYGADMPLPELNIEFYE